MPQPDGIEIEILGDAAPFSEIGRSICYRVAVGARSYLIDCGAPVFKYLGTDGVEAIQGIIETHCHDDHKRWLTDIALYRYYGPGHSPLRVLSHGPILEELEQSARPALERTLSDDSKRVVQHSYQTFINPQLLGPRPIYRIEARGQTQKTATPDWRVVDAAGEVLPPDRAKVVVHPGDLDSRPRMLLCDEQTGRWVDPENFYPFSDTAFYEAEQNIYRDESVDLSFSAIKATAWHGPPTISVLVTSGDNRVLFTSDTAYSRELWQSLVSEIHPQQFGELGPEAFATSHCIVGDINDFIQQTWSASRLERAREFYGEGVIIHDAAGRNSVVHTNYANLAGAFHQLLLTHTPDYFISQYPLAAFRKTLVVRAGKVYEQVGQRQHELAGDIYVRHGKWYRVGFKNPDGKFQVIDKNGILDVIPRHETTSHELVMHVDLYEDLHGQYVPVLDDPNQRYFIRPDGEIERVTYSASGSLGVVQSDMRLAILAELPSASAT